MTLKVWLKEGHTTAVVAQRAADFTNATGIDVETEVVSEGTAHDRLLSGSSRPDVVTVPYWYLDELLAADLLRAVDDPTLSTQVEGEFEPSAVAALTRHGSQWAVPHTLTGGMLSYRRDIAETLGFQPLSTTADVVRFADAVATAGAVTHPFLARTGPEFSSLETFAGWAWGQGEVLLPSHGGVDPVTADLALAQLLDLLRRPSFGPLLDSDYASLGGALSRGDAAMFLDTSAWGFFLEAQDSPVAGRMAYTTVEGPRAPVQFMYAEGLGVTSYCNRPSEALAFLAWRHSPEVVRAEAVALGRLDLPRRDLRDQDWFAEEVARRGLGEYLEVVWRAWALADLRHVALRPDFVPVARETMARIRSVLRGERSSLAQAHLDTGQPT